MKRIRDLRSSISNLLVAAGVGLVVLGLVGYARAALRQDQLKSRWEDLASDAVELPLLPGPPPDARGASTAAEALREGDPVARLAIPRIGLDAVVLEGISEKTLAVAPGHYPGMALPGEDGHVVVAGHRDSFFKDLGQLDAGDPIRVIRPDGRQLSYVVSRVYIVHKTDRTVIVPSDHELLTLITCYPFVYVGHAPYRYIVEATAAATDRSSDASALSPTHPAADPSATGD